MILKQDGSVWNCGLNSNGQLGTDVMMHSSTTFETAVSSGAIAIAAGGSHSLILRQDYGVLSAGLEVGRPSSQLNAFTIVGVIDLGKAVAAGVGHSLVLTKRGAVWAKGWNKYGQLGDGTYTDKAIFVMVIPRGAAAMAAGQVHSIVMMTDGSVWATGWNQSGQLGDGLMRTVNSRSNFVQVMSSGAKAVAAGASHSIVLKQDSSVWATGWNMYGQLGDGTTADTDVYHLVFNYAKAIAAGTRHTIVLKLDGSVWTTGYNRYGQLGDFSGSQREIFFPVISSGAKAVAAGGFHSMVLKDDGTLWTAGCNQYGQLGNAGAYVMAVNTFVRVADIDEGGCTKG